MAATRYRPFWPTLLLAALKFGVNGFGQNSAYELHRDEYLYLDQGRHLAWGFLEVPPATAIQAFLTQLMGESLYAIRFWPALWGALMLVFAGLIVLELGGGLFAQLLSGLSILLSAYLRLNSLFQPNALDSLVWTMGFYLLIRFLKTGNRRLFIAMGVVGAVGLLNKYATGFYLVGLVIALIISPRRRALFSREAVLGLLVLLILMAPNLLWQWRNNIPFLQHMRLLRESQLVNVSASNFISDQILFFLSAIWVWIAGLGALLFSGRDRLFRPVAVVYVVVIGILLALHGKGYYAIGLYPAMLAAGSVVWERLTQGAAWKLVWRSLMLIVVIGIIIPLFPLILPVLSPEKMIAFGKNAAGSGALRWEDGKNHPLPQDYADMLGWEEMTQLVAQALRQVPANQRAQTLIFTANYGQAGAINFYGQRYGLPQAYSFNSSYNFWLPRNPTLSNFIIVDDEPDDDLPAYFRTYNVIGSVKNPLARERGTQIILALNADSTFRRRFEASRLEHRREWNLPDDHGASTK